MTTPNIDLGKFGVFTLGGIFFEDPTVEQAQEIEHLGYDTLRVSGWPPAELSFAEPLLESTTALKVAAGRIIEVVRTFIPSERWARGSGGFARRSAYSKARGSAGGGY
jgi:hypothetical protein